MAMSLAGLIERWTEWLVATPAAHAISTSPYLFPSFEVVHVVGVGLTIGTTGIVDFRLVGFAFTDRKVSDVAGHVLPIAWTGFGIAVLSGALMFIANATQYVSNRPFQLKLVVLMLAGLNMLAFHGRTWRSIAAWDGAPKPPAAVRVAGAVSLGCWITVVFLGRWIGFV